MTKRTEANTEEDFRSGITHYENTYFFPVGTIPGFKLVDLSAAKNISIGAISYPYGPEMIVFMPKFAR